MSRYPTNPFPGHDGNPSQTIAGTGDIVAPKPKDTTEYSLEPEGERERIRAKYPVLNWQELDERASKASRKKRELIAEALAEGRLRTPGQIEKMALKLGCLPKEIEKQRMSPAMERLVQERIRRYALYYTAEALPSQAELAHRDVASFKAVAQVGDMLKSAGVNVQTNIAVDQRNGGDNLGDREWFKSFQERAGRNLRLVGGVMEPGTEAIEPEETHVGADPDDEPEPEPEPDEAPL